MPPRNHSKANVTRPGNATATPPFLKWAGGKRWLISQYASLFDVQIERYIEPFLGSGAVYFHLQPKVALLSDVNSELIDCYLAIKHQWKDVWRILKRHHRRHCAKYYYQERNRKRRVPAERAAQFIYLNRTCWNGLYRVNLAGVFNVPIGTKTSVVLDTDDFAQISKALTLAELQCQDFESTIDAACEGDFIFADPPYTVKHNRNGFLKYNESIFSWDDQRRLHSALMRAKSRGARILLLNADHGSVRDLYRNLGRCRTLSRKSVLAADASYRGMTTEIAIFADGRSS